MVSQPLCDRGAERAAGLALGRTAPPPLMPHERSPFVCAVHGTLGSGISSTEFGAAVDTPHAPLGPFQILRYHVTKGKLSGTEGHTEELVNFMWFP